MAQTDDVIAVLIGISLRVVYKIANNINKIIESKSSLLPLPPVLNFVNFASLVACFALRSKTLSINYSFEESIDYFFFAFSELVITY